jgi:hypothetical protein
MMKIFKSVFLVLFIVILSGCSGSFGLKQLDQKIGEIFFNEDASEEKRSVEGDAEGKNSKDLTASQKRKIDAWLEENGYNRYGDPADIIYLSGSPLLDENTGEAKERFEYILEKVPDVLEKIE